jgi:hypothetical protein
MRGDRSSSNPRAQRRGYKLRGEPRHPRFNNSSPIRIATSSVKLKAAQFITSLKRIAKQERKKGLAASLPPAHAH